MADENEDPLEGLLVDKNEFDRERLFQCLNGLIGIDSDTGEPVFRGAYSNLGGQEKVAATLLYRLAAKELGKLSEDDYGLGPKEVAEISGVNYNSVRGYLSNLNFVTKDDSVGGYYIPGHSLAEAIEEVGDNDE